MPEGAIRTPSGGGAGRRPGVTGARRIVVKVGSSSLTTAAGGLDADRVDALVDVLAKVRSGGEREIVLVSSGAIAAGLAPLGLVRRPKDLARQQAAASVGQGLLVARYTASFARYGVRVGQVLLTSDDTSRRAHYRNAYSTLDQLLEMGAFPVVNENDTVATDEIRFGDNDRLAALVAHLVHADLLVLLSDVDGLYDGDPSTPGTSRIAEVSGPADLDGVTIGSAGKAGVGTGGMVTKVEAARIATAAGIPVVLTSASQVADALGGTRHRHVLPPHRAPLGGPAAVAGPRLHAAGRPHPGRRRRARRRRAPHVPAARRDLRGRGRVLRGRPGRAARPRRPGRSPAGSSTSTPRRSPSCSAGPPATSPASWDPPTNGKSYTGTISSSSTPRPAP